MRLATLLLIRCKKCKLNLFIRLKKCIIALKLICDTMLKRKIESVLVEWKTSGSKKPLVIKGIRQCGVNKALESGLC